MAIEHSGPEKRHEKAIMRVLDLDLDFFVFPLPSGGFGADPLIDGRRSGRRYTPWSEAELRAYLESILGLAIESPIPGVLVQHHDAAYATWRTQVAVGRLRVPFDVVRIDAHADLGLGGQDHKAFDIIEREVLARPADERSPETPPGLTPGNYLLYAAAAGWLNRLTYVLHPERRRLDLPFGGHFDPPQPEVVEGDPVEIALRLRPRQLDVRTSTLPEVRVPLRIVPFLSYHATERFDFVILAQSPDFTPKEADELLPAFESYIRML